MRHLLALPLVALGLAGSSPAHACGMKMSSARSTVRLVQVLHQIQVQPTILVARQAPVDAALPGAPSVRINGPVPVASGARPLAALPALDQALGAAPQLAATPGR